MKIQIEEEPKEIAELLQAIEGSEEQNGINLSLDGADLARIIHNPSSVLNVKKHLNNELN